MFKCILQLFIKLEVQIKMYVMSQYYIYCLNSFNFLNKRIKTTNVKFSHRKKCTKENVEKKLKLE